MIRFQNISLRRGTQLLFENVTEDIHDGQKIGLIGDNGSGKTSLFSTLSGDISVDTGDLYLPQSTRISHVAQETPNNARRALDHVIDGHREYREITEKLDAVQGNHTEESAHLYSRMADIEGYSVPARAAKLLSGLGFKTSEHGNSTASFSGGWRVRLNLAQALMAPSDLLLLDEPTNHLDLDTIVWLEEWLKKYQGTLILISHDRDFIDACCQQIFHIEQGRIRSYSGNYSQFERQRAERLANEQSMYVKQQRKKTHMENYIRRFRYKADKARQAQSRIKALEKLQDIAPAHAGSPFNFEFKPCDRVSDPILKLEDGVAGYGENVVLSDINISIAPGDRIGLLGANGAGKSTLIKIMAGELALFSGIKLETRHLNLGYFAQHQLEQLDPSITPMQQFHRQYPQITTKEIRRFLGGFDFKGERVDEKIGPFSGGEKARLALALLIYDAPNLLLLDEPTNHLDMEMRHALNMAMQNYEGAIVLVSHDRNLINSVADRLILIHAGKVRGFNDDMNEYLKILRNTDANKPDQDNSKTDPAQGMSKKARRQLTAQKRQQLKPKKDEIKKCEKNMQQLQAEIDALNVVLNDPDIYETESTSNLSAMMQSKSDKASQLKMLEGKWLQTVESLEALEKHMEISESQ